VQRELLRRFLLRLRDPIKSSTFAKGIIPAMFMLFPFKTDKKFFWLNRRFGQIKNISFFFIFSAHKNSYFFPLWLCRKTRKSQEVFL
jgi:hypothetical protein